MLRILPAYLINKQAWDNCVTQDKDGLVYALSWYLDVVAPDWEGIVYEANNTYELVMPLPKRKLLFFKVIDQPLLTQQLGIFSSDQEKVTKFLPAILNLIFTKSSGIIQYSFRSVDCSWLHTHLSLEMRQNFILPLFKNYEEIKAGYKANRLRDLKTAQDNSLHIREGLKLFSPIYTLYEKTVFLKLNTKHQLQFKKIIPGIVKAASARNCIRMVGVFSASGDIVAGAIFLVFKSRLIYLLPAANSLGKKVGAATFLLDYIIRKEGGTRMVLDLEGSQMPGIARFYASFGAQPETYGLFTGKNLNLPVKFYSFLKRLRSKQ